MLVSCPVNTCNGDPSCRCRLDRVGVSVTSDSPENIIKRLNMKTQNEEMIAKCGEQNTECTTTNLVNDSHYITMLLLSWPYHADAFSNYVNCLAEHIEDTLASCNYTLQNECNFLRHQIQALIVMVKSHDQ